MILVNVISYRLGPRFDFFALADYFFVKRINGNDFCLFFDGILKEKMEEELTRSFGVSDFIWWSNIFSADRTTKFVNFKCVINDLECIVQVLYLWGLVDCTKNQLEQARFEGFFDRENTRICANSCTVKKHCQE